jgi:hypothetical protein
MPVTCVIENAFFTSSANMRHHGGHHRAQASPWGNRFGTDIGEIILHPSGKRRYPIGANIIIDTIDFSSTRDAEASQGLIWQVTILGGII